MNEFDPDFEPPSKSQLKREAEALQKLGEALIDLSPELLTPLSLPDNLLNALEQARHIKQHGARKRQIQYIGKLMRGIDPEPIRAMLEERQRAQRQQAKRLHVIEAWRDRLIAEGDEAMAALIDTYPEVDRAELRQLIRLARQERDTGKPAGAGRKLFRFVQALDGA
ncbi:MAG: DUF615 domain-containing protein [Gammaproteobacteria bacterium]|nr:DUF615 domain-containing protein [Gammaproteobacteria bacterium]